MNAVVASPPLVYTPRCQQNGYLENAESRFGLWPGVREAMSMSEIDTKDRGVLNRKQRGAGACWLCMRCICFSCTEQVDSP